jgi:hypothetical protein
MRNSFKDPAVQAEFVENGYVLLRTLSTEDAARVRDAACRFLPAAPQINDPQEGLYLSLFDHERRSSASEMVKQATAALVEDMLDDYYYATDHFIVKTPGSPMLPLHQHQPLTANIYEPVIHAWTTLDDVDDNNGALRVVPGSHALLRHVQSFNSPPYFAGFAHLVEERYAITVPMKAGETILFDRSLLHGSTPNSSPSLSIRMLSTLLPKESAFCILTEHGDGFEAHEVGSALTHIDAGLFCIAGGNLAGLKSAGWIKSRNMELNEAEFAGLLKLGQRIRPGYDPIDEVRSEIQRTRQASPWKTQLSTGRKVLSAWGDQMFKLGFADKA